jgi:predicted Zn-dependent protease
MNADALARLADAAIEAASDATAVEVMSSRVSGGVTRFADSQIHQNTAKDLWEVAVRCVLADGRAGVTSISSDDPADAAVAGSRAVALARLAPPDPSFAGVAGPVPTPPSPWCDPATAATTAAERAAVVAEIVTETAGVSAAGSVATDLTECVVRTSAGADLYGARSGAQINLVLTGPASTGHAESGSHAIGELDPARAARRALGKVRAGADAGPVEPGEWPVVLEPSAVASLIQYLGFVGFGAKVVDEDRSFASGRFGEAVLDPKVTMVDDALDPQGRGFPFDPEGTPKQRVEFVRRGVLTGVAHDRQSAARAGTVSTGHALPPPNPFGPLPMDPFVLPGDGGGIDDLVAGTERGLLVTRFHYVNVLQPKETVLTGMTRDGTFLVEDGRVVRPVRNLRFTQSVVDALGEVREISSETGYGTEILGGGTQLPALALPRFRFSGATDFG